jgi:hypothetical protein
MQKNHHRKSHAWAPLKDLATSVPRRLKEVIENGVGRGERPTAFYSICYDGYDVIFTDLNCLFFFFRNQSVILTHSVAARCQRLSTDNVLLLPVVTHCEQRLPSDNAWPLPAVAHCH